MERETVRLVPTRATSEFAQPATEVDQIAGAMEAGRRQLRGFLATTVSEQAPLKEDVARLLELGTLLHDIQACGRRLHEIASNLPMRPREPDQQENLSRLRNFVYAQEATAKRLEHDIWQLAFRRFEDGAVKMVEANREQALAGLENQNAGENEKTFAP